MTPETDPFRYCVYCAADCYEDDPAHADECPSVTGLWPVRDSDLHPCEKCGHPATQMCCVDCGHEFKIGDSYVLRGEDGTIIATPGDWSVSEVVCVGCGAMVDAA